MKQKSYTNPTCNPTWELRVKETKSQRDKGRKSGREEGKEKLGEGKEKLWEGWLKLWEGW